MARTRQHPKAAAITLAVTLLLAGLGTVRADHAVDSDFITTGHTTFLNAGTTFDDCFAGIAGAVMTRVIWFNGATLFNRMANGGGTWIYATETLDGEGHDKNKDGVDDETGARPFDPREETLYTTGNVWTFPDENDPSHDWKVHEYYHLQDATSSVYADTGGNVNVNPDAQKKIYVYAVRTSDNAITDQTIHRDYNFVLIVNTCQFLHRNSGDFQNVTHNDGQSDNPHQPAGQHDPNDVPPGGCTPSSQEDCTHDHDVFSVDIFIGGKPKAIPLPADPDQVDPQSGGAGDGGGSS